MLKRDENRNEESDFKNKGKTKRNQLHKHTPEEGKPIAEPYATNIN